MKRRLSKEKQDPFYIEKPYKTIPPVKYRDAGQCTDRGAHVLAAGAAACLPEAETIYADITGKGQHDNRIV
ncbi:hypothetical protein [Lentibacillus juripiscarius]|uniref:Uncharacterized protein n=1 Tax=Lentibacillus juripiscarius TaxID=257446 RepID=A0ABW5V1X2_9BACI